MPDYSIRLISDATTGRPQCSAADRLCPGGYFERYHVAPELPSSSRPKTGAPCWPTVRLHQLLHKHGGPTVSLSPTIRDPERRHGNRRLVTSVDLPCCRVTYVQNERTAGASGSWNTAVDFLFREVDDPADLFVAILDDDDAWAPDYLERCLALGCDHALDMVEQYVVEPSR